MNFKQAVAEQIASAAQMETEQILSLLEVPPDSHLGDLAFPCFSLAKVLRKAPAMIAQELSEKLTASEAIGKIEVVGGYLNIFYNQANFNRETLTEACTKREAYGRQTIGEGKTVLVEFSSPNIAKPFHIGHLCSTAIGSSIEKIHAFLGYNTVKINHLGDWGTQFGKLISAFKRWGDRETIEKDPIRELLKIYVRFHEEAKKDPALEDEARSYFKKLEDGDEETTALWQYFRDVSLTEFNRVYDLLGISFDSYAGESFYSDKMDAVVESIKEKGLLTESEGAQVVMLDEYNIPPCIIIKSDGATIYATRDLAAAIYRHNTYDFDKNIYVVGTPQALHFKQVFSVLKKMGNDWADRCMHVGFGLVKFKDKKLSTREGDVIFLEDVLNEAIAKTRAVIDAGNTELENKDEVAQKIGIGAVLYAFLKNSRERDIVFDWEELLDFDGESGPNVQYAYARAKSVLRRAPEVDAKSVDFSLLQTEQEYTLIKLIAGFGDAVIEAAEKNEPSVVTRYTTLIARQFNTFYNACPILKADDAVRNARLMLTDAASICIKTGLSLLGIETLEKM